MTMSDPRKRDPRYCRACGAVNELDGCPHATRFEESVPDSSTPYRTSEKSERIDRVQQTVLRRLK